MEKNKNHILVIDDDDRIRELVKEYLNECGFIVSTGNSAEEAKIRMKYLVGIFEISLIIFFIFLSKLVFASFSVKLFSVIFLFFNYFFIIFQ